MTPYTCMTREELTQEYEAVLEKYRQCQAQGLNLNMARGKPATKQLDLVSDMLRVLQTPEECYDGDIDSRNYGELAGLPEKLREAAKLRADHPEDTLAQLAQRCDPPITKSALNHRLRKLVELGKKG